MIKISKYGTLFGIGLLVTQSWGCAREDDKQLKAKTSTVLTTTTMFSYEPTALEGPEPSFACSSTVGTSHTTKGEKEKALRDRERALHEQDLAFVLTEMGAVPREMLEEIAALGMQQAMPHIDACRVWAPSHLRINESALSTLALEIAKEEPQIEIPLFKDDVKLTARYLDPGFSAGGMSLFLSKCLAQMSSMQESLGALPQAIVPGCGHGYDLWKMALVGTIIGVDNHPMLVSAKNKLNLPGKTAMRAVPYLPEGVKVRDRVKILDGDILQVLQNKVYQDFFHISYGSNFIHCLGPVHARAYAGALFGGMKSGGIVFESAHLPLVETFELYRQQIAKNKEFPGYVVENIIMDPAKKTSSSKYAILEETGEQVPPVELRFGPYRKGDKRKLTQKLRAQRQGGEDLYHRSIMGYDAKTLLTVMTRSGLVMDDLFYLTIDSKRVELSEVSADGTLTDKSQLETLVRVLFIGHKP
ncbi:MAG: hypothetical protein H2057_07830 [Alphaproteobacteria bacterium]|nr:hypothetical protein [Alphaproteobacteria bacterium]